LEHVATSENAWGGGTKFFWSKKYFFENDVIKNKKNKKILYNIYK